MNANPYEAPETTTGATRERGRLAVSATALFCSLIVMAPWPIMGATLGYSFLDGPGDVVIFFGGVTALLLLPLFFIIAPPDIVVGVALVVVWCLILVAPAVLAALRNMSSRSLTILCCIQSGISLAQTAMGFLLIIGRSV